MEGANSEDDLDQCFQNLNNLISNGKDLEITPIKEIQTIPSSYRGESEISPAYEIQKRHVIPLQSQQVRLPLPIKKPEEVLSQPIYNPMKVEDDPEIVRMREMLLSTQQEIDRIISGTEAINEIYNQSKQFTGTSVFHS